jgi:hypothetical protein
MPGLGRLHVVDERDKRFMLPREAPEPTKLAYKHWAAPQALDQGKTSSCVGHGAHQLLRCSPIRNIKNIPNPFDIYNAAQLIDEWPGIDPEVEGTSVRAGVKVLQKQGYISTYRWAFDGATAVNHLLSVGPVLIGVDWYQGMMRTDEHHYIHPTGWLAGGHCVPVVGVNTIAKNPDKSVGFAVILNSWGPGWGSKGRAKISLHDFDALIRAQGEAAAVQEVLKPIPAA